MTIAAFAQRLIAEDTSLRTLGITIVEASEGYAVASLTVRPEMANGHGIAQGGYVFTLADTAFAFAANSVLEGAATTDAQITYLAPSHVGDGLVADATVYFQDGRRVIVDVLVHAGDRKVAIFRGTGRALRAPSVG
ncbi:hotdog fold thioesterase [Georgenia sp. EYE_87]|uniref:PaaI family thioesterase n=1 Tax=Georgenia sp. EYE_87 TaxID=2853448 RepID=UPI0020057771|nr:hotdog fold thioesterase [Georgenia sp. EYE_87]MCK6212107.1 hotdog fold thioesterase [Georgenia sp. EYE_87]